MPIKLINMADTGAGKTGALASLAGAGYNLIGLDLDNGMEVLADVLTSAPGQALYGPEAYKRVKWKTLTEPMRSVGGLIQPKSATVWNRAVLAMEKFKGYRQITKEGKVEEVPEGDLGTINQWGNDTVFFLDTLSTLGTAANNFNLQMNGNLGKRRTSMEAARDIGTAQTSLDTFLQLVTDDSIQCHVILNTHVVFAKEDGSAIEMGYEGMRYCFPAAIGKALSPKIGKYFNHLLMTRREGTAQKIYTKGVAGAGLKSGSPSKVAMSYDIKDGLAKYFEAINGPLRPR